MNTNVHSLSHLAHFFLEWEMIQTKFVEKIKAHFMSINFFNHAVYEILWKNIVELGRPRMTIWGMPIACWMSKATNSHSE